MCGGVRRAGEEGKKWGSIGRKERKGKEKKNWVKEE